jgi:predicted DNA-binding WGR domain protein
MPSEYSSSELEDIAEIRKLLKLPLTQEQRLYRLEYTKRSENSDKFYELWIKPIDGMRTSLVARWGKRGSSGQTKIYTTGSESHCRNKAENLFSEKLKKGYKVISTS